MSFQSKLYINFSYTNYAEKYDLTCFVMQSNLQTNEIPCIYCEKGISDVTRPGQFIYDELTLKKL